MTTTTLGCIRHQPVMTKSLDQSAHQGISSHRRCSRGLVVVDQGIRPYHPCHLVSSSSYTACDIMRDRGRIPQAHSSSSPAAPRLFLNHSSRKSIAILCHDSGV